MSTPIYVRLDSGHQVRVTLRDIGWGRILAAVEDARRRGWALHNG